MRDDTKNGCVADYLTRGSTVITPNDEVHDSPVNLSLTADTMANAFAEIIIQNYESGSL